MYKKKETSNLEIAITIVAALLFVALVIGLFWYMIQGLGESFVDLGQALNWEVQVEKECLRLGYAESNATYGTVWDGYCTKIVDGTSVTVRLSELLGQ